MGKIDDTGVRTIIGILIELGFKEKDIQREYQFDSTPVGETLSLGLIQYIKKSGKTGRKVGIKSIRTPRLFRFDIAISSLRLAIEFEGGTFIRGAHNRGDIYFSDCQKYNLALSQGWRVLRFTTSYLNHPEIIGKEIVRLVEYLRNLERIGKVMHDGGSI